MQVVPVYYAMFTTASVASVGLVFREFQCLSSVRDAVIFGTGVLMAAGGVFLVQLKRDSAEEEKKEDDDKSTARALDVIMGLEDDLTLGNNRAECEEEEHPIRRGSMQSGNVDLKFEEWEDGDWEERGAASTLAALRNDHHRDIDELQQPPCLGPEPPNGRMHLREDELISTRTRAHAHTYAVAHEAKHSERAWRVHVRAFTRTWMHVR